MQIEENDIFGGTVNLAPRVIGAISGAEIWLSDRALGDIRQSAPIRHRHLTWKPHEEVKMKGFAGRYTLWSLLGSA